MDYKHSFVASPDPPLDGRQNPLLYTDFLSSNKELIYKQPLGPADAAYNFLHQNSLHDRSVQENLGPMFQPYGIDITRLPITNPPIFQSSLPAFDQPVYKRRISISNGQISQLGEDLETIENLHSCQPPFLSFKTQQNSGPQQVANLNTATYPSFSSNELQNIPQQNIPQQHEQATVIPEAAPQTGSEEFCPAMTPFDSNLKLSVPAVAATADIPSSTASIPLNNSGIDQTYINMQLRLQAQMQNKVWKNAQLSVNPCTPASNSSVSSSSSCQNICDHSNENESIHSSISHGANSNTANTSHQNADMTNATGLPYKLKSPDVNSIHIESKPQYEETISALSSNTNSGAVVNSGPSSTMHTSAAFQIKHEPRPQRMENNATGFEDGAKAWKRARLLERNRIAASKCRQRKKMSQLQLQKEFDQISKENTMMKKKIENYEKLVQKMKKISRLHLQECTVNNGNNSHQKSGNKDRDINVFLKMIEEMISGSTLYDE
ncbi:Aca1p [Saccharomyces paradoxus]|uniref:Aca1p n=1 Tax=Saccharomyces paradoxus TaxID=27291 RepID=A0A8B8UQ04_SACPA|nr:Aca1 [Saccharomyces paradoxus]QHS72828.1 Aca1 [Saccharomyces paradoxus]